jgi:carbonic anhydrase/acetyltransferase-like protein (isoleucine patch superfamily)
MVAEMVVTNVFHLSDGSTVLACEVQGNAGALVGRRANLVLGCEIKQSFLIAGERVMLNKAIGEEERAFETRDSLAITLEEAQSRRFRLVLL